MLYRENYINIATLESNYQSFMIGILRSDYTTKVYFMLIGEF